MWAGHATQIYSHFFYGATASRGPGSPHYRGITITPLSEGLPPNECSAHHSELYLTYNIQKRQISITPGGIRTRIPSKRTDADPHLNTLRTGDADLRFYITTVQDG